MSLSWNIFRLAGDFLHLFALIHLAQHSSRYEIARQISIKSQALLLAVYLFRYVEHGFLKQITYLIFFKAAFIALTAFTLHRTLQTRQKSAGTPEDPANFFFLISVAFLMTLVFPDNHLTTTWRFSEFLEAVAMIPQYLMLFQQQKTDGVSAEIDIYIKSMGCYRICYALNWAYKRYYMGAAYRDLTSWSAGILDILFFLDFLQSPSLLRRFANHLNGKFNDVQGAILVELKPRRVAVEESERIPIIEQI